MAKGNLSAWLFISALMLASLHAVPMVRAASPTVSVSPTNVVTEVRSVFQVHVQASDVSDLVGYDVTITYNENLLELTGNSISGTILDGRMHIIARQSKLPGSFSFAAALLGDSVTIPALAPASLLVLTFRLDLFGSSPLTLSDTVLVVKVGNEAVEAAHLAVSGSVRSTVEPDDIFIHDIKPSRDELHILVGERTVDLLMVVRNKGTTNVTAFAIFKLVSLSGLSIDVRSPTQIVPAGSTVTLSGSFRVDPIPDAFVGSGVLSISLDGMTFTALQALPLDEPFFATTDLPGV